MSPVRKPCMRVLCGEDLLWAGKRDNTCFCCMPLYRVLLCCGNKCTGKQIWSGWRAEAQSA